MLRFRIPTLHGLYMGLALLISAGLSGSQAGGLDKLPPEVQEPFTARVVGVVDGDTLDILTPTSRQMRIRMAGIDAPEKNQSYGQKAKQALSDMAYGQMVDVFPEDGDRYGRLVATVFVGQTNVNAALVKTGAAWAYYDPTSSRPMQFLKDPTLLTLQDQARATHAGLWALQPDQIIPPWEFRKAKKEHRTPQPWGAPATPAILADDDAFGPVSPPPPQPWYRSWLPW